MKIILEVKDGNISIEQEGFKSTSELENVLNSAMFQVRNKRLQSLEQGLLEAFKSLRDLSSVLKETFQEEPVKASSVDVFDIEVTKNV